jgi:hypothetical protein
VRVQDRVAAMTIADALELARQMGLSRRTRIVECFAREQHDLQTISMSPVRVDYCRHCGSLFADDVLLNSPPAPRYGR